MQKIFGGIKMEDLTRGNIYKTFILFALPMVLAGLLSQTYSIVNTIIAGKLIGEVGLASLGATAPLIDMISSLFWGYGVGMSVYIAKLFGAKQYIKIKETIFVFFFTVFIATTLICVTMILFNKPLFDLLNIDNSIRKDALDYFTVYMIGFFIIIFNSVSIFFINAFGIGNFPLYMSIISTVLTITGNILSITLFDLGVVGLALSTVLAGVAVFVMYLFKYRSIFKEMGVHKEKTRLRFGILKESLSYSGAATVQQMIIYAAPFIISPYINAIGSYATAAYTVVSRIFSIVAAVYQNSARTVSNYAAQCMGAKKYTKIKKSVYVGFVQGVVFIAPFLALFVFAARPVCLMFFKDGSAGESLNSAVVFSTFYLPFVLFNVINNLFHSFFRGVNAPSCLVYSTLLGCISKVLSTIYFINCGYEMNGVYMGWVVSWIIESLFVIYIFYSGKWKPIEMTCEI